MRPAFLKNWREIEPAGADETFGRAALLSDAVAMHRLKVMHLRLPPGARSPLSRDDEEAFYFVLQGAPDLWMDGRLHRLREGDGVAADDRTGISQCLFNNSDEEVRLFVFGEGARRPASGDARPDPASARAERRPEHVVNWRDILKAEAKRYPNSDEDQGIDAPFGNRARFSRIGIHFEVLKPGRRTSYPHAERDEDEFVYVVSGKVDAWNDGHVAPMEEGDFIGWEAGTGITHAIMNNGEEDALLLVGGEASRVKNQYWYPFHPERNEAAGKNHWADHPLPDLGPHDGLPDALRIRR